MTGPYERFFEMNILSGICLTKIDKNRENAFLKLTSIIIEDNIKNMMEVHVLTVIEMKIQ